MDLLASNVLGSSTNTVTFSSIPSTYRDLVLVLDANWATINSSSYIAFRANGDTGSSYSSVLLYNSAGGARSASSGPDTEGYLTWQSIGSGDPAPKFHAILQFQDYATTNKHKPVLSRINEVSIAVHAAAARWASTNAITSLTIRSGQSFAAGSTFYLYGIVG